VVREDDPLACLFMRVDGFPGCEVLALRGELDVTVAEELSSELAGVMSGERWMIVDLDGLSFMDCSSLRELAAARERARLAGGDVLLAGPRGVVAQVLELTGFNEVFPVFPGVASAAFSLGLAALGGRLAVRAAGAVEGMVTAAASLPL
jgi:anti-anti-sigma factor